MKDKIAEVLLKWDSIIADKGLADDMAVEVLDLIAKENEKAIIDARLEELDYFYKYGLDFKELDERIAQLKDIKHKLGVE